MQTMDDRDGFIWLDGKLVDWRSAQVHVLNQGLHYASSVFEGERAYKGKVFKLREHTERLFYSAEILKMKINFTVQQIIDAHAEVIEANGLSDCYIRPVVYRGSEVMGLLPSNNPAHVAIAAWVWPSYFDMATKMKGIRLKTATYKRPSPETEPVHSKAAGLYMICSLEKLDAEQKGFNDAMFLDYRGYIAEATGANIFFKMTDGNLHTPIADCFLNGITRRTAMELAQKNGIKVIERHIKPEELSQVTECFLCGTAAEITPVSSIDDHHFNPGNTCQSMVSWYNELVNN